MTGELDGEAYEFRREGRKRFVMVRAGRTVCSADAGRRGRWAVSVEDSVYELARRSTWRSEMELRDGGATVGSIRKAPRGKVRCELPPELPPAAQAFVGLVVRTLWKRAAAASGASAAAAGASVSG